MTFRERTKVIILPSSISSNFSFSFPSTQPLIKMAETFLFFFSKKVLCSCRRDIEVGRLPSQLIENFTCSFSNLSTSQDRLHIHASLSVSKHILQTVNVNTDPSSSSFAALIYCLSKASFKLFVDSAVLLCHESAKQIQALVVEEKEEEEWPLYHLSIQDDTRLQSLSESMFNWIREALREKEREKEDKDRWEASTQLLFMANVSQVDDCIFCVIITRISSRNVVVERFF